MSAATAPRPLSPEAVRQALAPAATRLARLASLVHFLGGLLRSRGEPVPDLGPLFDQACAIVRGYQEAAAAGEHDQASARLASADQKVREIEAATAALDATVSVEALESYLALAGSLRSEELARTMDFYLEHLPRPAGAPRKVLAIGAAFAHRDPRKRREREALEQFLAERGILPDRVEPLAPAHRARVAALHSILCLIEQPDNGGASSANVAAARLAVDALAVEIGEALFTRQGLATVLWLRLIAERVEEARRVREERLLDGILADLADLDTIAAEPEAAAPARRAAPTAVDPDAIAQLTALEREIREALAAGGDAADGYLLEAVEVEAFRTAGPDRDTATLLTRGAACRSAIDRLARADSGSDAGSIPVGAAATYVRIALEIESALHQRCEPLLRDHGYDRAKTVTRSMHRLARARTDLALLADLPMTTLAVAAATVEPDPTASRPRPGLNPRRQVAATATAAPGPLAAALATVRRRLATAVRAAAVLAAVFHGARLLADKSTERPSYDLAPLFAAAPLAACQPVAGTLAAVADPRWQTRDAAGRRAYLERLGEAAAPVGLHTVVVMSPDGSHPIGLIASGRVELFEASSAPSSDGPDPSPDMP